MPGLRVTFVSHLILTTSLQDTIFPGLLQQNLGSGNLFSHLAIKWTRQDSVPGLFASRVYVIIKKKTDTNTCLVVPGCLCD